MGFGHLDNLADRGDVAIHRVDRFEGDDLGPVAHRLQLAVQIAPVVVFPDDLVGPRMADALDHAGMVAGIRQDDGIGNPCAKRRQRRPVRHVTGGEQQRRFLAVQVGQFCLQRDVMHGIARDVARPARAGAAGLYGIHHRADDIRVMGHSQIIVGTPDGDLARFVHVVDRPGLFAALALQIGIDAVIAFGLQGAKLFREETVKIHGESPSARHWPGLSFSVRAHQSSSATVSGREAAAP